MSTNTYSSCKTSPRFIKMVSVLGSISVLLLTLHVSSFINCQIATNKQQQQQTNHQLHSYLRNFRQPASGDHRINAATYKPAQYDTIQTRDNIDKNEINKRQALNRRSLALQLASSSTATSQSAHEKLTMPTMKLEHRSGDLFLSSSLQPEVAQNKKSASLRMTAPPSQLRATPTTTDAPIKNPTTTTPTGNEEFVIASSASSSSSSSANSLATLNSNNTSYSLISDQQQQIDSVANKTNLEYTNQTTTTTTTTTTQSPIAAMDESGSKPEVVAQQAAHRAHAARLKQMQQFTALSSSGSQPISSAPSSTSVIVPLQALFDSSSTARSLSTKQASIEPQTSPTGNESSQTTVSQQQLGANGASSSQSMMKPLLVIGQPISEQDYATNLYETSQRQPTNQSDTAEPTSSLLASQQVDSIGAALLSQKQLVPKSISSPDDSSSSSGSPTTSIGDRVSGPPLVYSSGTLGPVVSATQPASQAQDQGQGQSQQQIPNASHDLQPRLFQSRMQHGTVFGNTNRKPSLPPPVNQANAASGFRSPLSPSGPLIGATPATLAPPLNYNNGISGINLAGPAGSALAPYAGPTGHSSAPSAQNQQFALSSSSQSTYGSSSSSSSSLPSPSPSPSNNKQQTALQVQQQQAAYPGRRLNITRVEHISAECSNDLIRAVIVFNGTFKGIIYSSGYVNDPTCLYVNGTGSSRYEFNIRLNQCGTLGRQELHQPSVPGEARRRDQVMWNTLSIQYNSVIEQEWDEHFRVSCEYGSDFWKTVSFSPFNVETNTGAPVIFTINPPQCQMDVLLGHGLGPKIAVDGPVTVGDPLTLLIHMKSEKAGYDILVKNCIAHNGGQQRMQLIDANGCVVNERFISPFRGTYNDNDFRHVTLYAYLKAFRFTGSPVLYLECEIHMCQSACPPQTCYWRRLSKRSLSDSDYNNQDNDPNMSNATMSMSMSAAMHGRFDKQKSVVSDSLSLFKALQVRNEHPSSSSSFDNNNKGSNKLANQDNVEAEALASTASLIGTTRDVFARDDEASLVCYRHAEVVVFLVTICALLLLVVTISVTCCYKIRRLQRITNEKLAAAAAAVANSSRPVSAASSLLTLAATPSANEHQATGHKVNGNKPVVPTRPTAQKLLQQFNMQLNQRISKTHNSSSNAPRYQSQPLPPPPPSQQQQQHHNAAPDNRWR